jgi:hypothetical protein
VDKPRSGTWSVPAPFHGGLIHELITAPSASGHAINTVLALLPLDEGGALNVSKEALDQADAAASDNPGSTLFSWQHEEYKRTPLTLDQHLQFKTLLDETSGDAAFDHLTRKLAELAESALDENTLPKAQAACQTAGFNWGNFDERVFFFRSEAGSGWIVPICRHPRSHGVLDIPAALGKGSKATIAMIATTFTAARPLKKVHSRMAELPSLEPHVVAT